ncbi:MAG: two-component regulator propeller domain-containing protein [Candidatus Hatepunaea meridiana]|nr:two-component regulator propeller domain-containing protein [Candidatus Hatepunaea meridiana]
MQILKIFITGQQRSRVLITLIIIISLSVLSIPATAQDYAFYTYSEDDFPELGEIHSIFQDSRGFIWLAGERGVVYYDGVDFKRLSVSNGLSDNYCYDFTEDSTGNIWISTWKGITKYDYRTSQMKITPVLYDDAVRDILLFDDCQIIATSGRPVIAKEKGFYDIILIDSLNNIDFITVVNDLLYDNKKGVLWCTTDNFGIFAVNLDGYMDVWEMKDKSLQEELNRIGREKFLEKHPELRCPIDRFNIIIDAFKIDSETKRNKFFLDHIRRYDYRDEFSDWCVKSLSLDPQGNVWARAENGIFKLSGDRFYIQQDLTDLAGGKVTGFDIDEQGDKYIAGVNGLFILSETDTLHLNENNGLVSNQIASFFKDRQGIYWIASVSGKLQKLPSKAFRVYNTRKLPLLEGIFATIKLSDGSLLLGGPKGLALYADGNFRPYFFQPKPDDPFRGFAFDKHNNLILSTQNSIYHLRGNRVKLLTDTLQSSKYPINYAIDKQGILWFVQGGQLLSWNGRKLLFHPELENHYIALSTFLFSAPDSSLFIGTWHGLHRMKGSELHKYRQTWIGYINDIFEDQEFETIKVFPISQVLDHVVTCGDVGPDTAMWFGTFGGGLLRLKGDSLRSFEMRDGLNGRKFTSVYRTENGDLYFLGDEGICRVGREGVNPVCDLGDVKLFAYGRRHTGDPQGRSYSKFYRMIVDSKGHKLFGTSNGLLIAKGRKHIRCNRNFGLFENRITDIQEIGKDEYLLIQPHCVTIFKSDIYFNTRHSIEKPILTEVWGNGNRYSLDKTITFRLGQRDINAKFTLIDFFNEKHILYSWKLDGFDSEFASFSSSRNIQYKKLHPGKYRLHLRALDSKKNNIIGEQLVEMIIPARFYETFTFMIGVALVGLFIIYMVVLWRIRYIKLINIRLEEKVHQRTSELTEAMGELEKSRQSEIQAAKLCTAQKLAGSVAHEFNQPLQILMSVEELLKHRILKDEIINNQKDIEKTKSLFERIPEAVDRISYLVKRLLNITSIKDMNYTSDEVILDLHRSADDEDKS